VLELQLEQADGLDGLARRTGDRDFSGLGDAIGPKSNYLWIMPAETPAGGRPK